MASVNLFTGVGRIVRDVEAKQVKPGLTKAILTLAIETVIRSKDGEKKDVCFIDCTVWNDEALKAADLKKGTEVFIKGRLRLETWTDPKSGIERKKHTIAADTLMYNFKLDDSLSSTDYEESPAPKPAPRPVAKPLVNEFDDELPF